MVSFHLIIKSNKKMKYIQLCRKTRSAFFSLQDLRQLWQKVFGYQLTLWQKKGHILRLKNGLYVFAGRVNEVAPEEIAGLLYSPGYISLEKALSIYGFIPEMVYGITSVTPKTTRRFKNKIGDYTFRHIKPDLFFGYRQSGAASRKYLLAEPEKALLDFIYFNLGRVSSKSGLAGLRLNRRLIKSKISRGKMARYLAVFKDKRIERAINWIMGAGKDADL